MAMPDIKRFWTELRRRKVVRVAIVYAVVAWALIEGAYLVFPELLLPEWTSRLVLVLALAGFPIALVLAWAFEISPDGVLLTPPAKFNGGATPMDDVSKARPSEIAAEPLPGRRAIAVLPMINILQGT